MKAADEARLAGLIAKLDRSADKVATVFNELYRVTDLMYSTAAELRRSSTALFQVRQPRKKVTHARTRKARR